MKAQFSTTVIIAVHQRQLGFIYFLLMITSARVGQWHALARSSPCMHWWPDDSKMTLWLNKVPKGL